MPRDATGSRADCRSVERGSSPLRGAEANAGGSTFGSYPEEGFAPFSISLVPRRLGWVGAQGATWPPKPRKRVRVLPGPQGPPRQAISSEGKRGRMRRRPRRFGDVLKAGPIVRIDRDRVRFPASPPRARARGCVLPRHGRNPGATPGGSTTGAQLDGRAPALQAVR